MRSKNELLTKTYASAPLDAGILIEELLSYADRLRSMVVDSGLLLYDLLSAGKTVVLRVDRRQCSILTTEPTRTLHLRLLVREGCNRFWSSAVYDR